MFYNELIDEFRYKKSGELKYQTIESYTRRLKNQILPYFDDNGYSLNDKEILERWLYHLIYTEGYAVSYANTLKNTLSAFINFLVSKDIVTDNYLSGIASLKDFSPIEPFDFWEFDEFCTFIKCIDEPLWETFFSVLYYTGMRVGEIRALTWKQIDFKSNRITINRSISKRPNFQGQFVITSPKNNHIRSLAMNNTLITVLNIWKMNCNQRKGFKETDLVFKRKDGESLSTTTIERRKNMYCEAAGVKQIRIHDFRHSNASLLINIGTPVNVVSDRLGHRDKRQTLNIYSHLFPSAERVLIDKIDDLTNVYNNKHENFAKALIDFLNTVSSIDDLNEHEQKLISAINEIAFSRKSLKTTSKVS